MAGNPFFIPQQPTGGGAHFRFGNIPQMAQAFQTFRNGFSGNPEQIVRGMLNSGKMTQEQFNTLAQAASDFQHMIGA